MKKQLYLPILSSLMTLTASPENTFSFSNWVSRLNPCAFSVLSKNSSPSFSQDSSSQGRLAFFLGSVVVCKFGFTLINNYRQKKQLVQETAENKYTYLAREMEQYKRTGKPIEEAQSEELRRLDAVRHNSLSPQLMILDRFLSTWGSPDTAQKLEICQKCRSELEKKREEVGNAIITREAIARQDGLQLD